MRPGAARRPGFVRWSFPGVGLVGLVALSGGWASAAPAGAPDGTLEAGPVVESARAIPACPAAVFDPEPPEYYALDLVSTRRLVGTGRAAGTAEVTFAPSPFGVALAADGSYLLDVWIDVEGLPEPPDDGAFVAWLTTTDLSEVHRVGPLDADGRARGRVAWNKFLVVITYEASPDPPAAGAPDAALWSGPVVLRGMSRSGMMHTMAGHGPFEQENCATYGY